MTKKTTTLFLVLILHGFAYGQIPKSGTYVYKVAYAEWGGKSMGSTVLVKIIRDSIYIIHNGSMNGTKGDTIDKGVILLHKKTKKWTIGHNKEDINANEIGGCSDGPSEIDFKRKRFWLC